MPGHGAKAGKRAEDRTEANTRLVGLMLETIRDSGPGTRL